MSKSLFYQQCFTDIVGLNFLAFPICLFNRFIIIAHQKCLFLHKHSYKSLKNMTDDIGKLLFSLVLQILLFGFYTLSSPKCRYGKRYKQKVTFWQQATRQLPKRIAPSAQRLNLPDAQLEISHAKVLIVTFMSRCSQRVFTLKNILNLSLTEIASKRFKIYLALIAIYVHILTLLQSYRCITFIDNVI